MMNGSQRAAVALGVGYVLGRRRKLRAATVLAAATAVGGMSIGGLVMRRGAEMVVKSGVMDKVPPQVSDLADVVRGDLLTAGKAAVTSAVSGRLDSVTDSLHDRAERLRDPGAAVAEGAEAATGTAKGAAGAARSAAGGTTRRLRRRGADAEHDETQAEPDDTEDAYAEDEDAYTEDEYDEGDEPEQDERPARHTAASGRRRSPVTRTRR
jgi:hypothetical protein